MAMATPPFDPFAAPLSARPWGRRGGLFQEFDKKQQIFHQEKHKKTTSQLKIRVFQNFDCFLVSLSFRSFLILGPELLTQNPITSLQFSCWNSYSRLSPGAPASEFRFARFFGAIKNWQKPCRCWTTLLEQANKPNHPVHTGKLT